MNVVWFPRWRRPVGPALAIAILAAPHAGRAQDAQAPTVFLDASPRAIQYQLDRLTNDELTRVERKDDDPKYRPVYVAMLTRKGLARGFFDEALAALVKIDRSTPAAVLLDALGAVQAEDQETGEKLLRVLLAQPADALRQDRKRFTEAVASPASAWVTRAAYGAMMRADGDPAAAWQAASAHEGHLIELLHSVPYLDGGPDLGAKLFDPVAALLKSAKEPALRAAAVSALGSTRQDAATFKLLAHEVLQATDADVRAAAVRALHRLPRDAWSQPDVEPLARGLIALVTKTPPEQRTEPASIDAVQLAEALAAALPDASRREVRRDVRALGVQVVRVATVPEQMLFTVKWFAVEAGKPVQVVMTNPDTMSHNFVVTKPGALKEVATLSSTMALPSDPAAKAYVPDSPLVLHATRLLNWGETERLNFAAPDQPGEYPFVCTFPGHWVRMYGVMLVVPDMEAWEAKPTTPTDPISGKPFTAPRQ